MLQRIPKRQRPLGKHHQANGEWFGLFWSIYVYAPWATYSGMHKYNESVGAVESRKGFVALIQHPPVNFWCSKAKMDPQLTSLC